MRHLLPFILTLCMAGAASAQLCGDCDGNGMAGQITDALAAAQLAASGIPPTGIQLATCDVDSTAAVSILDALVLAQFAAGLPVVISHASGRRISG